MIVKYSKFELPEDIKIETETKTSTFTRFIAGPFERGFGFTLGNALRRVLLNSLEAPAVVSVEIEGVSHEYTPLEGVIEDMIHIVLNIKEILVKHPASSEKKVDLLNQTHIVSSIVDVTDEMLKSGGGQYVVTPKDIFSNSSFDVVNPDHPLFTVTKPLKKRVALRLAVGRGYVSAEVHKIADLTTDEIVIDSGFSPVRLVNYFVENTRVGQNTDYDLLVIEVTTDGRISPQEALTFGAQIAVLHFDVFNKIAFQELSFDRQESDLDLDRDVLFGKLALKINEIELSVRSTNCLVQADIATIAELVTMSEADMLKFRNFGKKSLKEIKEKLEEMHLSLGMNLSKYGINKENVMQVLSEYFQEQSGQETT